ncbi:MAG: hypothetical protein VB050_04900 [Geobacteraceae bacterium]|nr:hypothetical protein [Geobacteraceae bacterium]
MTLSDQRTLALLKWQGFLHEWHPEGYGKHKQMDVDQQAMVLTPLSIVNPFKAGYAPETAITSP